MLQAFRQCAQPLTGMLWNIAPRPPWRRANPELTRASGNEPQQADSAYGEPP